MLVGGLKRRTPADTVVDIVHVRAGPPLGSGTEPGREAQKLHPVRTAWMAVVHTARIRHQASGGDA